MKPVETIYLLATSSKDYADCHALDLAENGKSEKPAFSFPTVLAKRDGKVIGFLSTFHKKKMIVAGPLVVQGGRNPILAMRLVEAYDRVMAHCGVSMYYFAVDANRVDTFSRERLESIGATHWETVNGIVWMRRYVPGQPRAA